MYRLTRLEEFEANGGPYIERINEGATRTRPGRYTIGSVGKHTSSNRWAYSTITWGTPIKLEHNIVKVQNRGGWNNLSSLPAFSMYRNDEFRLTNEIISIYRDYKEPLIAAGKLSVSERHRLLPSFWIFNDFGHIAIKYFRDVNNNHRQDKNEPTMSDFIHTVPAEEYLSSHGIYSQLPSSHGCIHLHSKDIDRVILLYVRIGSSLVVHDYKCGPIPVTFRSNMGTPPFELHFFPYFSNLGNGEVTGKLVAYSCHKIS